MIKVFICDNQPIVCEGLTKILSLDKEINYEGAAGSVDFDKHGDVVTPIEVWKYSEGNIVTVKIEHEIPVEEDITRQKPEMRKNALP